ncbi:RNA recognition motif domain [Trypanosoma melophagium]|uniref:RNA recognition motif domain n=1 Tax=Trypanosoma melophagium TaxID=715481 RepID=UPI00351A5D48|nr:RNA recognition motif domain [Trypanosoma melophagium]
MTQVTQQRFGCYIGNIDRSVSLDVLRQVFSQCGTIIDCSLNGRDEDPYRYGFIDFASENDRARAMKYNGFTLAGRKIKVGVSKGNVGRPEGFNNTNSNTNNNNNNTNNNSSNNAANNNAGNQQQSQMQQPQIPAISLAANLLPSLVQQQQQSAQLLLQLIHQGAIDVNKLSPDQQQLLMANLLPQTTPPTPGIPAIPPAAPIAYPPMQQLWGAARGGGGGGGGGTGVGVGSGYQNVAPMNRNMAFTRGPANPMPSEETMKLREVQRKQFLDVVRRDAEKYERKMQERSAKEGRAGSVSGSEDNSSSDEEGGERQRRVHRRKEAGDADTAEQHDPHSSGHKNSNESKENSEGNNATATADRNDGDGHDGRVKENENNNNNNNNDNNNGNDNPSIDRGEVEEMNEKNENKEMLEDKESATETSDDRVHI